MFPRPALCCAALLSLAACAPDPLAIPGPAPSVTRGEAVAIAHIYAATPWIPEARHVRHGRDSDGILVHTPDISLNAQGFANGWWRPDVTATGVPYQWGGFDTPREFLGSLERGEAAGDISSAAKRRLGDAGVSAEACGIDCSGLVSRCWRLDRPHSTAELPAISRPLKAWVHLKPGDILLNHRHVLLFKNWGDPQMQTILFYEAGPFPEWRVCGALILVSKLVREGYQPRRYLQIRD